MLESMIVYSVTIMLLFFILAIFSVLFQRWNIQTVANEAASRYAQTYRFSDKDEYSGYITKTQLLAVGDYRYFFGGDDLEHSAQNNIKDYALNRLNKTTFTNYINEPEITVSVEEDNIARRHVKVTIKGEYKVPLGDILSYFGYDSNIKYETTAYADCVDLIDYVNTTNFFHNQVENNVLDSSLVSLMDSVLGIFDNVKHLNDK